MNNGEDRLDRSRPRNCAPIALVDGPSSTWLVRVGTAIDAVCTEQISQGPGALRVAKLTTVGSR